MPRVGESGLKLIRLDDGSVTVIVYDDDGKPHSKTVSGADFVDGVFKVCHPGWREDATHEATRELVRRVHLGKEAPRG